MTYIFNKVDHKNYVGIMEKLGHVIISLKSEEKALDCDSENQWRAILRMKEAVDIRALIPSNQKKEKYILPMIHPQIITSKLVKIPNDGDKPIKQRLISLDEMRLIKKYKFGVLLVRENQHDENEMFGNGKIDFNCRTSFSWVL